MLLPADNVRMTRVGPGTPMGRLFRSYWIPALLSEELPERDGLPQRVRLLGEDMLVSRDADGNVDLDAYPTWEGGGIVWTYMGTPDAQPPVPDYELVRTPSTHHFASKTFEDCNFLQALEGGVDPTHATILHNEKIGDRSFLRDFRSIVANLEIEVTAYGIFYAGIRDHGDDEQWVRGYHYIMPSYHMRGTVDAVFWGRKEATPTINGHIWVPIDDEHTWTYNFMYSYDPGQPITRDQAIYDEARAGRGPDDLLPGYLPKRNASNGYLIDRAKQRATSFTGITGINTQDFAVQEGMGAIVDRSKEHLGTTDRVVITLRRVLLDALERGERGEALPGAEPQTYRTLRAIDRRIPRDAPWHETLRTEFLARF